jgi:formiminotetrahydrofolate cyclodeaminase
MVLNYPTKELLDRFGKGQHKPGSGSAAALDGLVAANLVNTVALLTMKERYRVNYPEIQASCEQFIQALEFRNIPDLERLFELDCTVFDRVIRLRRLIQNNLTKPEVRRRFKLILDDETRQAIIVPFHIAASCLELSYMAKKMFSEAFKGARGDSMVAMSSALAAVRGCLTIMELNLQSLPGDEWTVRMADRINSMKRAYEDRTREMCECADRLDNETRTGIEFKRQVEISIEKWKTEVSSAKMTSSQVSSEFKSLLLRDQKFAKAEDILDKLPASAKPESVFRLVLGYEVKIDDLSLIKPFSDKTSVAGAIDQDRKIAKVSSSLPETSIRFTLAHELGHALMHRQTILHRERESQYGEAGYKRGKIEAQADQFAAAFLMPDKLVQEHVQARFGLSRMVINQVTANRLGFKSTSHALARFRTLREFSLHIATLNHYGTGPIVPLTEFFIVSASAMAIRLEELNLVSLD